MVFLWIIAYGVIYVLSENISSSLENSPSITGPVMLLYCAALLFWLHKRGLWKQMGLHSVPHRHWKRCLFFIPLATIPVCNLLSADLPLTISSVMVMLSVSVAEELFFRGFLLELCSRKSRPIGILLTSILFALAHILNLFHEVNLLYALMQVLCAFVSGICFSLLVTSGSGILPCIAVHFLINVTSSVTTSVNIPGLLICIGICCLYSVWLYKVFKAIFIRKGNPYETLY